MKVEIWSDVMCPFCYIGKRKFEQGLQQFAYKEQVEIEWKSFQLNPSMKTDPSKTINEFLAEHKGVSVTQAKQMNDHVTAIASEVGLQYDFDKSIVANSFDAHRLSHFAKKYGVQNVVEELLFKAYFTEGKNAADHETLITIGTEAGLNPDEIRTMLAGNDFADSVNNDIYEAQQVGARGVPFFMFDNRYAVSGAQPAELFLQVLNKVFE
jgi:predicted DsbA family dithiol-disulfide isomerase